MSIEQDKKIQSLYASLKNVIDLNLTKDEQEHFLEWSHKLILDSAHEKNKLDLLKKMRPLKGKIDAVSKELFRSLKVEKKKYEPKNYPADLSIGDIVHVNYGFPYCSELGDGHYGVVLSKIQGSSYLIIPLSSEPYNKFVYPITGLNLPNKDHLGSEKISYIKFNHAQYIHYRRLENVNGCGRKNVGDKIDDICQKFLEFLDLPTRHE
ncbi:hypothetical protein [Lacrimispora indolis]|uniref:hypothetical protein n=1 Tax=Lacrimispora indolis TaxID=69825 RepID=UPI000400BA93|nr:hypothetical protein [[Clostridium] methoxybenzovorans]